MAVLGAPVTGRRLALPEPRGPWSESLLALLRENFVKALKEFGLEEIPAAGIPFDPFVHEGIQQVNDETLPDNIVKDVVRKGYTFQKRVLRPAQVVVAKNERYESKGEQDA